MLKELLDDRHYPLKRIEDVEELKRYEDTLIELMMLHRSRREIASVLMCNDLLLDEYASLFYNTTFEHLKNTFEERSNALLISSQFDTALNDRNAKMSIFLGKNYAKQVEDASTLVQLQADNVVIVDDVSNELQEGNINDNDI